MTVPVRRLNERLWSLVTKPGPLTAAEWAYVEEQERLDACDDQIAGNG